MSLSQKRGPASSLRRLRRATLSSPVQANGVSHEHRPLKTDWNAAPAGHAAPDMPVARLVHTISPIGLLTRHRPFDWESNSRAAPPGHAAPAIPLPPRLGYTTDRALKTDGVYAAPGNVLVSKKTEN